MLHFMKTGDGTLISEMGSTKQLVTKCVPWPAEAVTAMVTLPGSC